MAAISEIVSPVLPVYSATVRITDELAAIAKAAVVLEQSPPAGLGSCASEFCCPHTGRVFTVQGEDYLGSDT